MFPSAYRRSLGPQQRARETRNEDLAAPLHSQHGCWLLVQLEKKLLVISSNPYF